MSTKSVKHVKSILQPMERASSSVYSSLFTYQSPTVALDQFHVKISVKSQETSIIRLLRSSGVVLDLEQSVYMNTLSF